MQTLFLPDKIQIDFLDVNNNPFEQQNILIGIRIFTNNEDEMILSPLFTDKNGTLTINAIDFQRCLDNIIPYKKRNLQELETEKPEIEIFYWGNKNLDSYIKFWTKMLVASEGMGKMEMWSESLRLQQIQFHKREENERKNLGLYETCYNRTTEIYDNIVLIQDKWDKASSELKYTVKLDIKK